MYLNRASSIVVLLIDLWVTDGAYFFDRPRPTYPTLYRHYVIRNLSAMGKELFFASSIHPSCLKLKGSCVKRKQCHMQILYISRVCYKRDFVCCYDNRERFPSVRYVTKKKPITKPTTTHPPDDEKGTGGGGTGGGGASQAGGGETTAGGDEPPPP